MTRTTKPTDKGAILLHDLLPEYIAWRNERRPIGRDVSPRTVRYYGHCYNAFGTYLRRDPTLGDLRPEIVNAWLTEMLESGKAASTVHSLRVGVGTIWRYAVRMKLTRVRPDDVRPIHLPALKPQGYSAEQAALLLAQADKELGNVRETGIPRRLWMKSMVVVLWDTGIRCGDLARIKVKDFDAAGCKLFIHESKTGKSGFKLLRPSTCEIIAASVAAAPEREFIWPGRKPLAIWRSFKRLARKAGLPGGTKWMRRGSASEVERSQPGAGWRFLSHSTPEVFEKHYRDVRLTDKGALLPPELAGVPSGVTACVASDDLGTMEWI